ncbi:hypothetical protein CVT26_007842 [Gymnopilus dilepis]|uniref:F-box domain-containing protein n=1 Tax=Gymnopilus dilepis TaxID=231916 RepID=A0A409W7V7_9AGAR|nr:hypothetical protein CVT26_007842 [Gymnopilus dilepis]
MVQNSALSVDWVIDNVPPDVWRHIFGFLDLKSYEGYRVEDGDVVRLSHVCCLWRDVVNNSPELWTEVDLYVSPMVMRPGIGLLSRILHNSRDMPLVMSLEIHGNSTAPSNLINDACQLFFREVLRAEHLDLRIYGQTPLQGIEAEIQGGLMLQSLCINIPYEDEGIMSVVSKLWSPAPSLQSLILAHIGHGFPLKNIGFLQAHNFPFQQVTDLEVEFDIHLDVICRLVPLMPSLAFVTLNGVLDARELINPLERPSIQDLTLEGCQCGFPHPSMQLLDFALSPSLTSLWLKRGHQCSAYSSLRFFKRILRKSLSCLEHLYFDFTPSTDEEKIDCLKLLPCLRTLDLTAKSYRHARSEFGSQFCDAMQEWDRSTQTFALCPQLEKLVINHETLEHTASAIFAEMIEERWMRYMAAGQTFEVKIINVGERLHDAEMVDDIMHIQALKKSGLRVTIKPNDWLKRYFYQRCLI